MEMKIERAEQKARTYQKRFNRVQNDYQKMIEITADLVDTLESLVSGHQVSSSFRWNFPPQ